MLTRGTDIWNAIASTCSAVIALAGLSAIWFQLRAGHATMQADVDAQVYARLDAINTILVDKPALEKALQQPFGTANDDAISARNLADMFFTLFEQIHRQRSLYAAPTLRHTKPLMTEEQWQAWELTIVNAMRYPFLRGYWREARTRYPPTFVKEMDNVLAAPRYQSLLNTKV